MCGRYTLYQKEDHLSDRFNLAAKPVIKVTNNYNVSPGQAMPVITQSGTGNVADLMRWGFVPSWSKDMKIGYRLINARSESLFAKPMWSKAVLNYRCLIPASGFYEWQLAGDSKSKQPFFIHPKDQQLFAFAGLWSLFKDAEGFETKTFSIITTGANKEMATVHDRMPVILKPGQESHWLEPSLGQQDVLSMLVPYEDNKLDIYEVSPDVNNPRNNDAHLVHKL